MGARIANGIGRSNKGKGLREHFVVALHARQLQGNVQGGRTIHCCHGILCTGIFGAHLFETGYKRPYARHKIGIDALVKVFLFVPDKTGIVKGNKGSGLVKLRANKTAKVINFYHSGK